MDLDLRILITKNRIALLSGRDISANAKIIKKLERQLRKYEKLKEER